MAAADQALAELGHTLQPLEARLACLDRQRLCVVMGDGTIVEPFDPGHPARTGPNPGNCTAQPSTVGIEQCFDTKTENTDARIDTAQLARFRRSTTAAKVAINNQDRE